MDRDPILWMQTGQDTEPLRSRMVKVDGRLVKHRFPQTGHQGDYDDYRPAGIRRFTYFVRHDGNVVAHVLTCAAADPDHNGPFGQWQMSEARSLGWFNPGQCPCALLLTGELRDDQIVSDEVRAAKPCPAGTYGWADPIVFTDNCPHSKLERAARLKRHADEQAAIALSYKAEGMIQAENQSKTLELLTDLVRKQSETPKGKLEK